MTAATITPLSPVVERDEELGAYPYPANGGVVSRALTEVLGRPLPPVSEQWRTWLLPGCRVLVTCGQVDGVTYIRVRRGNTLVPIVWRTTGELQRAVRAAITLPVR